MMAVENLDYQYSVVRFWQEGQYCKVLVKRSICVGFYSEEKSMPVVSVDLSMI